MKLWILLFVVVSSSFLAYQNEAWAQSNNSASNSDSIFYKVLPYIIPVITLVVGLFGGHFLSVRKDRMSKEYQDIKSKRDAYDHIIFEIRRMIDNPRFLHGIEGPVEFHETLKHVELQLLESLRENQRKEYLILRDEYPKAAAEDCEERKQFAEKVRIFLNSLIEQYDSEVVRAYNHISNRKDRKPEIPKEDRSISCVENPDTGDIFLEWK